MNTNVSPSNIEQRAEALVKSSEVAAETKPAEEKQEVKAEVKTPETKVPDTKTEVKAEIKPEVKAETKVPNDPAELRKWNTRISQENAALRDEMRGLKNAIEKLSKKPVDYKELAKNPEAIQKQIEQERQEAIAEMEDKLAEATTRALKNETVVERIKRENDKENYPEWGRVFPLIQNLASNTDGRINFNKPISDVLDDLYDLALQLSPVPPVVAAPAPVQLAAPIKTAEEVAAEIAAAEKRGFEKAQAALKDEQNGGGIGGLGKGGKRSSGVSKEALQSMPLKDLKALISKE